ncbi:MAG: hypothetical protein Q8K06_17070 [Sulfuriferula sp.]|nr:hypothetical protein [Sulfuriferula sp.]
MPKPSSTGALPAADAACSNTPYQAFAFPAVTARYFKVKLLSGKDGYATAYEFQLFGTLK